MPGADKTTEQWPVDARLAVIIETATLSETELAQYCSKKGLYPEQISQWKRTWRRWNKSAEDRRPGGNKAGAGQPLNGRGRAADTDGVSPAGVCQPAAIAYPWRFIPPCQRPQHSTQYSQSTNKVYQKPSLNQPIEREITISFPAPNSVLQTSYALCNAVRKGP